MKSTRVYKYIVQDGDKTSIVFLHVECAELVRDKVKDSVSVMRSCVAPGETCNSCGVY